MKNSLKKTFRTAAAAAAAAALALTPFAALVPSASAASYINTAVPTNTSLTSGLVLQYSFDGTKVSGSSVTDESGNGKNATLSAVGSVDALIVGSGGSGGKGIGGGGGGGDVVEHSSIAVTAQGYTIVVGGGGTAVSANATHGNPGNSSTGFGFTSTGGGYGGAGDAADKDGGGGANGGGGGYTGVGGTGTAGFNGGNGVGGLSAGGGGGDGAVGANGTAAPHNGGIGGAGKSSSYSGAAVIYGAGGGGGGGSAGGAGGSSGIGGDGGTADGAATAGDTNTGSGGGGTYATSNSGAGGSGVVIVRYRTGSLTARGGTVTTSGIYTIHTFTSSGTFTVGASVDALIVGGGGGGGWNSGGGGGGGEVKTVTAISVSAVGYAIVIGTGGAGGTITTFQGGVGVASTGFGYSASGGGGGGGNDSSAPNGGNGASGGGGAGRSPAGTGGTGSPGYNGGAGYAGSAGGGGGGGMGSVGSAGSFDSPWYNGGWGGTGVSSTYSGASVNYGGGGGGSGQGAGGSRGQGQDGGGAGGDSNNLPAAGSANRGGGGGGAGIFGGEGNGAAGGSGVVIVRYPTGSLTATCAGGAAPAQSGGNDICTFTSDGTFTVTSVPANPVPAAALRVPGKIGQGLKFDGTNASTTVGNVSSSVKSVAFWVKVATSTTAQSIIDLDGSTANIKIVSGVLTPGAGFTSPTVYIDGVAGTTLNNKNWHHVVVTTGTNVNASSVKLGVVGTTYFGGTLDDLRMYNRALSASEVSRLYGLGGTSYINTAVPSNTNNSSGLVLQYSFDGTKVSGTTVTDESGNGKTGTLSRKIYVDDVFSAFTYTGNGATQTITNGIDLAGKGGLVWGKSRSTIDNNVGFDSARGLSAGALSSNLTNGNIPYNDVTAFNSSGFSLNNSSTLNTSGTTYASWTFRKAPKFFDVVTYTGDGTSAREINHNLGASPGMIIVKRTDSTGDWQVWHRSAGGGGYSLLLLNTTDANVSTGFDNAAFTSTTHSATSFTLGQGTRLNNTNANGATYVAYVFANDTSTDGLIQEGSFTTDGSQNATIALGWEPQYLLMKRTDLAGDWVVVDVSRAMSITGNYWLTANTSNAENTASTFVYPTATGFNIHDFGASRTYVYLAIRRPNKPPTNSTQVYNAIARTGTGAAATVTGVGFAPDLVFSKGRNNNESGFYDRLRGSNLTLFTTGTTAETPTTDTLMSFNMDGFTAGVDASYYNINKSTYTYANWNFKRAPGVFDTVAYTGTGSDTTINHNLGVAPELIIRKARIATGVSYGDHWGVWSKAASNTNTGGAFLQTTDQYYPGDTAFTEIPTATTFKPSGTSWNVNTKTYVAYLFATKAGVSKVGSYTGDGTSGKVINAGFTTGARYILIKRTDSTGDWYVWDSTRGIVAGNDGHISLNTTSAEVTTDDSIDSDNSGFIVNQLAATNINVSSATYIYLALAADNGASALTSGTSGSFVRTPGKIGQGIKFDGSVASTTVGSVSSSVKSVAFWVKANSTTQQNIIDLNGSGANIEIVNGVVTANGFTSPTIYVDGAVTSTLNNKNWHHVVVTTGTNVNASAVVLGVVGTTYFGGTLDDLRMYNRALSAAEVTRLYGLGGTSYINTAVPSNTNNSSGLVLQYSFDGIKVSGSSVTDESGNGKTGTNSGAGSSGSVDALIVGGGGSGGFSGGGGGGGGRVRELTAIAVTEQGYSIVVGAGGASRNVQATGLVGGNTSAFGFINGGGGGGGADYDGSANETGSSGGGGFGTNAGTSSFGNIGGNGTTGGGGGGGGAGAPGTNATLDNGKAGGVGIVSTYSGASVFYGSGGGGSGQGAGGSGGTDGVNYGRGAPAGALAAGDGGANSGNGGGGSTSSNLRSGAGGSGIVIVRYPTGSLTATCAGGAAPTQSGGNDICTYTSDGTFTPTSFPATSKTIQRVPGKIGQAVYFNGSATSTSVGNVSSSVKSVAFWVKVATSTTAQSIIDLDGSTANIKIVNGVLTPGAGFTSPTVYIDGVAGTTLNNKNWHHVVVTTGTNVNASAVVLGKVSTNYFGGTLDDLRMYNRALTAAEAKRLYQLGN